jgi:phospholipid/cholesterol/gamma-HCH transport system substrate-binding protein
LENKADDALVGFLVIILSTALISFSLWLSVGFNKKSYRTYAVYIKEAVSGLNQESPVKYNGVQVGQVTSIELDINDPQQVIILLSIEESTPITQSTQATLIAQGITGNTYIGLSATSPDLRPLKKLKNQPYPVIPAKPSLLNQIDKTMNEVAANINRVSTDLEKLLTPENVTHLQQTLQNLDKFSNVLSSNSTALDKILKNTQIASGNLPNLLSNASHTFDTIANQTMPPMQNLIDKLTALAINLEKLTNKARYNPNIFIRGTATPKNGPGE